MLKPAFILIESIGEPKAKVLLSYRSLPGVKDKDDFEAVSDT